MNDNSPSVYAERNSTPVVLGRTLTVQVGQAFPDPTELTDPNRFGRLDS